MRSYYKKKLYKLALYLVDTERSCWMDLIGLSQLMVTVDVVPLQMFLTARAVYLIVFDLTEDLDTTKPVSQVGETHGVVNM